MFAIIRTRWQTRPLSHRAKRRSSAAPGSLRKKYAGIAYPPIMVPLPNHSTTFGDPRKPVLYGSPEISRHECVFYLGHGSIAGTTRAPRHLYRADEAGAQATAQSERTRLLLVANRFHAISQASMMSAKLRNTELASQWLRR